MRVREFDCHDTFARLPRRERVKARLLYVCGPYRRIIVGTDTATDKEQTWEDREEVPQRCAVQIGLCALDKYGSQQHVRFSVFAYIQSSVYSKFSHPTLHFQRACEPEQISPHRLSLCNLCVPTLSSFGLLLVVWQGVGGA
eukprot:2930449-Amphidinium_carterae.1